MKTMPFGNILYIYLKLVTKKHSKTSALMVFLLVFLTYYNIIRNIRLKQFFNQYKIQLRKKML